MSFHLRLSTAVMLGLFAAAQSATADDAPGTGCHSVLLLGVVDGDTVHGYIDTSDPQVAVRVKIRLLGIDTPEAGGRAQCVEERRKAKAAKDFLQLTLQRALEKPTRSLVRACEVRDDKYASRRLSRLEIVDAGKHWTDVGKLMVEQGLAFPYDGGARGKHWCNCLQGGQCPSGYLGGS